MSDAAERKPLIPFADESADGVHEAADNVRKRRGALLNLDRMLLHSPNVAERWIAFANSLRNSTTLTPALQEVAILAVASRKGAEYVLFHHKRRASEYGISGAALEAILAGNASDEALSPDEQLVAETAATVTESQQLPDELAEAVVSRFGERGLVEIILFTLFYGMVSGFTEEMRVPLDNVGPWLERGKS